jgi:hypothetical protein
MDESADKGLGDGDDAANKAVKSSAGETGSGSPEHKLPIVWSPKLDAGDDIADEAFVFGAGDAADSETAKAAAGGSAAPAAPSRSSRFALLAASVAIAAAVGSYVATLTAVGIGHVFSASAAPVPGASIADANNVMHALKSELAELASLKANLDGAARNANAQFTAIADRLDRVEHAQADPAAKLAHISDTVDRLDKISAAPETTGSIAPGAASPAAAPTEAKITDRILQDWIVQGVHGDRALVESRYGGEFLVGAGSMLPGLGRVDAVKRQDGQWVVITAHGLIMSGR